MEIRFDQLLLVIMVVLFTLADVVFRRLRKRAGGEQREGQLEEGAPLDHEAAYDEEIVHEDIFAPPPPPPPPPPPQLPLPERPTAARVLPHKPAPRPAAPVRHAPRPPSSRPARAAFRRPDALGLAIDAREARRAIVLMTVLGPCRALESDHRG